MALYSSYAAERVANGPHDVGPIDEAAETFMREASIGDGWLHPRSSNYTFVVDLTLDERHAFGVYKPRQGEAPLWDFPMGSLYKRECATYELSKLLGWYLVPPTVEREGEAGVGSIQLFVPCADNANFFTMRDSHRDALFRMAVFDVIANNADRKGGHCLSDGHGQLWGVDHGLTFHDEHKLRTIIWDFAGLDVRPDLLPDVQRLFDTLCAGESEGYERLARFLTEREMDALRLRVRALLDKPVMPHPVSRRDVPYPWL